MSDPARPSIRQLGSPAPVLGLLVLFGGFFLIPPVRGSASLVPTFLGVAALLVAWTLLLWALPSVRRQGFALELVRPLKAHYVQALIQITIYVYWGWYWPRVFAEAPLILAQIVFLYAFDALLSWSRGRRWRLGLGPWPVILSANLFLWFRDDWFYLQFLLIATCVLGKEFARWTRDGRNTHIFNPSAFGLGVFSIVLIATGTTTKLTWGVEVAQTLGLPPYIYLLIFGLGLVVQYLFSVTLMTVTAVAAMVLLNLAYTGATGVYQFVDTNIPIAVFLGLHLLMTDPSTSPRTNTGRVIFGALYGVGSFFFYSLLRVWEAPEFYDKLLTVPVLNLSVQLLDGLGRFGLVGRIERWQARIRPTTLNWVTMSCWSALFGALFLGGYFGRSHPGASIEFWRKAALEGKPHAAENIVRLLQSRAADGASDAQNQLGLLYLDGRLVERDEQAAASLFSSSCDQGNVYGCANLVEQFLAHDAVLAGEPVLRALDALERDISLKPRARTCYVLGHAFETGRGRPYDMARALDLYRRGSAYGSAEASKALVRTQILGTSDDPSDLNLALRGLERACEAGDAESCTYLAYLLHAGQGIAPDEERSMALLAQARQLDPDDADVAPNGPEGWSDWLNGQNLR